VAADVDTTPPVINVATLSPAADGNSNWRRTVPVTERRERAEPKRVDAVARQVLAVVAAAAVLPRRLR
jgi:hypothetical protein